MKVLDFFCGAGGASMGIHRAGHEVEGLDMDAVALESYPFKSHLLDFNRVANGMVGFVSSFDAYHASPPCQAYSYATTQWRNKGNEYVDLVAKVRQFLLKTGKPFVIENVPNAPIRKDLTLCMSMFDDGREFMVRRHRVFEIHGFEVPQIEHIKHIGKVGDGRIISVFGHGGGKRYNHATSDLNAWRTAMGLPWVKKRRQISEAIPPEYTQYIFSFLREVK